MTTQQTQQDHPTPEYRPDTEPTGANIRPRRRRPINEDPRLPLRNILNLVFMAGALVGVAVYLYGNSRTGTIIVLAAMAVKIVECVLRFAK